MRTLFIDLLFVFLIGILLSLGVLTASAQAPTTWTHPGSVNSKTELDFVKAKIAAKAQPWYSAYQQLLQIATPSTGVTVPNINGAQATENACRDQAKQAYANALVWYYTGNTTYAQSSIAILNSWAKQVTAPYQYVVNGGNQNMLNCGWISSILGPAAELMRMYPGWAPADISAMQTMFKTMFYPGLNNMSTWNGNNDLVQIEGMIDLAIFCEDATEFNAALKRLALRNPSYFYLGTDNNASRTYGGNSYPGSWSSPTLIVDGLEQETCRDNNHHAQFAMASALHICEAAWHQGVDVYDDVTSNNTKRYVATMELMAHQLVTGNMQGTCANNTTTTELYDGFEFGYNHYHYRKNMSLPYTEQLLKTKIRNPLAASDWNIFYETVTHADIDSINVAASSIVVSPKPLAVPLASTAHAIAVVGPTGASQQVNWISRNANIISVDANGLITGVAVGSAYVVAQTAKGNFFDSTLCTVAKINVTGIAIKQATLSIAQSASGQLTPVFTPLNVSNQSVTWKSSNPVVATVSNTGLVTALKMGTAIITVTTAEGSYTATATITVTNNPRIITATQIATTPIIDGNLSESFWQLTDTIKKVVEGTLNNKETFGLVWDNTNLYIGVKVVDATIISTNTPYYNSDNVEMYFAMDNNLVGAYTAKDFEYDLVATTASIVGVAVGQATSPTSGIKAVSIKTATGYNAEVAIPWTTLGVTPNTAALYGFDIAIDDADAAGTRTNQTLWMGDANDWNTTTNFGAIQLLNAVVNKTVDTTLSACSSLVFNGKMYSKSGNYTVGTTPNDTLLHLAINQPTTSSTTTTSVGSYELNGQMYTKSGTYTQVLTNQAGCDSTITLHIIINTPPGVVINEKACSSFVYHGITYTNSGTFTVTLKDILGNDSIISLILTINNPTYSSISVSSVGNYSLLGNIYTKSGTYSVTTVNKAGCDSIITVHVTIVDFTALLQKIAEAETVLANAKGNIGTLPTEYPLQAYKTLNSADSLANSVANNQSATVQDVAQQVTTLDKAITVFNASKNPLANTKKLTSIIDSSTSIIQTVLVPIEFSQSSVKTVQTAIAEAKLVMNNPKSSQAQVDSSRTYLETVIATFYSSKLTIVDVVHNHTLRVWPIPTADVIHICLDQSIKHVAIVDITGKYLVNSLVNGNEILVDLSSVPFGTYTIIVKTDDNSVLTKKVSK